MFNWRNFFQELEIKQRADIGLMFPVKQIHSSFTSGINNHVVFM